jgi:prepilin-type N-terminal cleavage/methylation domain-containing protein
MNRTDHKGFTLVEVLVALTILGVALIAVMKIFPESIKQTRKAAERQQVSFLAKTELGKLRAGGVGPLLTGWAANNAYRNPAAAGGTYFDPVPGLYKSWTSTVKRISSDVDLYRVTFNVEMFDGRRERFVTYVTEQ